jgi:hypothetical protein
MRGVSCNQEEINIAKMHEKEAFQKLADLLSTLAPENWSYLQSVYLFHDGAMKLKHYYREAERSYWKPFNTGSMGFDVMDWWEAYHKLVKESEGNDFKIAKAVIDSGGNLEMNLSYDAVDPLADIDILEISERLGKYS